MNHLTLKPNGDYRYRSGAVGNVIEVEISYWKDVRRRGIYASVRPIELRDGCCSFVLMSGTTAFCQDLPRKNPKVLAACADRLDSLVPSLVETFLANPSSVKQMIAECFAAKATA